MPGTTVDLPPRYSKRQQKRKPRSPLWRLRLLQIALAAGFVAIGARLYYLQIYKGNELTQRATVQRQQHNLLVHRGAITDRHGLPLAIDTTRYDIFVHPELLKAGKREAAATLGRITGQDVQKMYRLLTAGYPVVTVARHLEREAVESLQSLNWPGIDIVPRPFRHYPEGHLAAHLLGYVNMDTHGQGGIEQAEEESLKDTGTLGKPQLDGHGRTILLPQKQPQWDITPPLGRHVELTIDNRLQHLAEKELSAMARHSHALRGAALIADPTNGEILAWANYPSYDPNNYHKFPYEVTKNWSMVDVYQPGSTFKVITVSSALDSGTIRKNSTFYDGGSLTIGNRTVHNHDGGHGTLDLLHLFIHSSNIASAQVALSMSPKQFHQKLKDFGLGAPTGIDLPGESAGLLTHHKYWKPLDQATTGFGQGAIATTPLQLVAAVGAIANDGVWVQPHLIKRVYDPRTGVTEKWTEPKRRQVVSKDTAKHVASLLADNIAMGTQIAGKVPGYRVAGKTGTAQKTAVGGRGYIPGATIASFIGFLPADNPQLLCLVVVDSPQTDGRWGNTIAGPVFNTIAMEAARYLGIRESYLAEGKSKVKMCEAPSVKYAKELGLTPPPNQAASQAVATQELSPIKMVYAPPPATIPAQPSNTVAGAQPSNMVPEARPSNMVPGARPSNMVPGALPSNAVPPSSMSSNASGRSTYSASSVRAAYTASPGRSTYTAGPDGSTSTTNPGRADYATNPGRADYATNPGRSAYSSTPNRSAYATAAGDQANAVQSPSAAPTDFTQTPIKSTEYTEPAATHNSHSHMSAPIPGPAPAPARRDRHAQQPVAIESELPPARHAYSSAGSMSSEYATREQRERPKQSLHRSINPPPRKEPAPIVERVFVPSTQESVSTSVNSDQIPSRPADNGTQGELNAEQ